MGGRSDRPLDPATTTLGVLVLGAILVTISWRIGRQLVCDCPQALASSYRNRFFIRLGLANAAALTGFVGVNLTGSALPYVAGLGWAAVGCLRLAPTASRLERC